MGLGVPNQARRTIEVHSHLQNPAKADTGVVHQLKRDSLSNFWNWTRRLWTEEIRRIRKGTEAIARQFCSRSHWNPL